MKELKIQSTTYRDLGVPANRKDSRVKDSAVLHEVFEDKLMESRDPEFVLKCYNENRELFSEICLNYISGVVGRTLSNKLNILDVSHDLLLKVLSGLENWRADKSKFKTWLHAVSKNGAIDSIRRDGSREKTLRKEDAYHKSLYRDPLELIVDQQHRRYKKRVVRDAVALLAPHDATLIYFRYFEDKKPSEISELLGIPVPSIKSQLYRAKKKLLEILVAEKSNLVN